MSKELEDEFNAICAIANPEIQAQLKIVDEALAKAEEISEQYGVPFQSDISRIRQCFAPKSFHQSRFFTTIDLEETDCTAKWMDEYRLKSGGWEHSAFC